MSIYQDDSVKNLKFLHNGSDVTAQIKVDSFSCENILSDDQLNFGSCNAARAEFVTITDLDLKGEDIVIQYGYNLIWENLGVFTITSANAQNNSDEVKCIGYDCVKKFDEDVSEWYIGLTFPISLINFRSSLCNRIGVAQKNRSLVNDQMQIEETIAPSKLKAKDLLKWIGELNGVFPHASKDGKLDWVSLGTGSNEILPSVVQGSNSVTQKKYQTNPIRRVVIRSEDGDIGAAAGSGSNTYYVTGNALCYGMDPSNLSAVASNLYNAIAGHSYTPTKLTMKSDPTIDMGSLLEFNGTYFYLLQRSTSGLLFDEIRCEGKEDLEEDTSIQTSIEQLRGKTNVLTRDVDQTSSKVEAIESDYTTHTEFTQTADAIQVEIRQIESQLDGDIELFYVNDPPTLENYPSWDWTGMYARDGSDVTPDPDDGVYYASDDLYFQYPATELQRHLRSIAYDEDNTITYRFIKSNGSFLWQEVADTETSLILQKITNLEYTTEGISSEVGQISIDLGNDEIILNETKTKAEQTAEGFSWLVQSGTSSTSLVLTDGCISAIADKLEVSGDMIVNGTTISNKVKATDFELSGGKIDITTNASGDARNLITLKSDNSSTFYSPDGISILDTDHSAYKLAAVNIKGYQAEINVPTYFGSTSESSSASIVDGAINGRSLDVGAITHGSSLTIIPQKLLLTATDSSPSAIQIVKPVQVTMQAIFRGNVYKADGTSIVFVSDRNKKHDIRSLDEDNTAKFVYSLNPVEYRFNDGDSKRLHHGLIAQEVKESMGADDWGVYCDVKDGDDEYCGVRYDELIADLISVVQSQNKRIKALEELVQKGGQ